MNSFFARGILLGLGVLLHLYAYGTAWPLIVGGVVFLAGWGGVGLLQVGRMQARSVYILIFFTGYVAAGVAAVYANYFLDYVQLHGDPGRFFEYATGKGTGLSLSELREVHEGSLAIAVWARVYEAFGYIGVPSERYVGVAVNVAAVAVSAGIGASIVSMIYGGDGRKARTFGYLISCCGLYWMFAAIHLRDAVVVLVVTFLVFLWIRMLERPRIDSRFAAVLIGSVGGAFILGFLRAEFVFVPIAMAVAAVGGLLLGTGDQKVRVSTQLIGGLGLVVAVALFSVFGTEILERLTKGNQGYAELGGAQSSTESLGMSLVINQPALVRAVVGIFYLMFFPIPVWAGIGLESAYHLFRSLNAIYLYFVAPLFVVGLRTVVADVGARTPAVLFLLFFGGGMTLVVVMTSLESRHFGVFLFPLLLFSLVSDYSLEWTRAMYRTTLKLLLLVIGVVHVFWVALRFL